MTARDRGHVEEREPKYKHGDVLYNNNGSKIEIIDIVADQYKFDCGDEYPHYEFFAYIESNYSKEPVSEDEKIRKWIRKELESKYVVDNIVNNEMADKALAWLEKQGEQKPTDIVPQDFEKYVEHLVSLSDGEGHGSPAKLKEVCSELLRLAKSQPKQEWSEEDKCMLNNVIDTLKPLSQTTHSGYAINSMIDWLKSLRPQNWTKEDKERYISCLQRLGTGNPEQPETINSKWFKDHVCPQPAWKPSDEQITVLHDVAAYIDNSIYPDQKDILVNLYLQLKKLREE